FQRRLRAGSARRPLHRGALARTMSRAIAFALLFAPLLAAQNGGTVEGVVVSTVTGMGIPGVGVTVFTRQSLRYETRTSDSGAFRVTNIADGTYEVRLEKDGYNRGKSDP